jgi:hypothetical protein
LEPVCPTAKRNGAARRRAVRPISPSLLLAVGIALWTGGAHASDRWEEAGSGAVAILPPPQAAKGIAGASLVCAEQRWSFLFRTEPGAVVPGWRSPATLTAGGIVLESEAVEVGGSVSMALPADHLEALKRASRMAFAATDGTVAAGFPLRGSRAVLDAVEPRCSQVDMSAYRRIALSETDPAVETAKALLAEEARLFRAETGKQPVHAAATVDLAGGGRLLFASLCGSTSYYGRSGCTLSGFASDGPGSEWRPVYGNEGVLLYIDPGVSSGGWPNLVTLPPNGGSEPDHWAWNGQEYENVEALVAGDGEIAPAEEGDSAQ